VTQAVACSAPVPHGESEEIVEQHGEDAAVGGAGGIRGERTDVHAHTIEWFAAVVDVPGRRAEAEQPLRGGAIGDHRFVRNAHDLRLFIVW
jgi:hypothetical protein